MDIALNFSQNINEFFCDIALDGPDIEINEDLKTAVILSLFTDRRANRDDSVQGRDRRGWWADTFAEIKNDKFGSRLWLLSREKQTSLTLTRAREFCIEALKWLIDDKVAKKISVETEFIGLGVLGIKIDITKPNETIVPFKFEYAWSQLK